MTDDMCYVEDTKDTLLSGETLTKFNETIVAKWLHCLKCPACTIRYSMIQMDKSVRSLDMRVNIMEFTKAINLTVQYAQIGDKYRLPGDTENKKSTIDHFMRTVFGILSNKTRPSKQGFTFAIDYRDVDERTREGMNKYIHERIFH